MGKAVISALLSTKASRKRTVCIAAAFSALYLFFFCTGYFIYDTETRYSDASGFGSRLCGFLLGIAVLLTCQCAAVFAIRGLSKISVPKGAAVLAVSCVYAAGVTAVNYSGNQSAAALLFGYFFPAAAVFALLSRLCLDGGILPAAVYAVITQAEQLIPVAPESTGFAGICLDIVLPVMFIIALSCFDEDDEKKPGKYESKHGAKEKKPKSKVKRTVFGSLIALGIALSIVFAAGILPIKPTTIATGSMVPELNIGDIAIVSTIDNDNIEVGDIIMFRRDGLNIVHRVTEVNSNGGSVTYTTKGDANNAEDSGSVSQSDIEGKVVGKIPVIGKFTLWINGIE